MKRIINTILAATLFAASAISCQKAGDDQEKERIISVSLTATMDELTPAEEVKSGVTPVIRLTWASEGDVVFVYDASKCLGSLDVTLKNNDSRYAYLSGTIEAPSDGTEVLTCIHAKGLAEAPSMEGGKVTVSLAEQNGQDSEIPFVVFGTIDYNGQSSITDRLVNFSFATSVVNVNCIDLAMDGQNQEQIDKAYVKGLNTACQLSLSGTTAPEVSGSDIGGITRKGIAGGSNKLAFLMSVPVSPVASERALYVFQQTKIMHSSFTKAAFAAGKFINVMYKLEPSDGVESVSLDTESKVLYIDEEFTLTATVLPEDAAVKDVKWSSSNENVATVDENGKVKGVAKGAATITVTTVDGGKTATCQVIVGSHVESVSLSTESEALYIGEEFTLTATVLPEDAEVKDVKWSSSDKNVATVDENGKVTAVGIGDALITVTTEDGQKTANCEIAVIYKSVPVGAIAGEFTVADPDGTADSGDETRVYFSEGNLWYGKVNGAQAVTFNFETNQYDYKVSGYNPDESYWTWDSNHISHFFWSKYAFVAIADTYSESGQSESDVFFTNKTGTSAKEGFTVNVDGKDWKGWRTLSKDEWTYLLNTRKVNGGTKEGKSYQRAAINTDATSVYGIILFPDNYIGGAKTSYSSAEWASLEDAGCVFLPATGYRMSTDVRNVNYYGRYWSSSADSSRVDAYSVLFSSTDDVCPDNCDSRDYGYGVRLVTECMTSAGIGAGNFEKEEW